MKNKKRMVTLQSVIPSVTMRNYLKNIENDFTDAQLAAMIYHHELWGWKKKREEFTCLYHETEDRELKEKIDKYITIWDNAYDAFRESDSEYVFELDLKDHKNAGWIFQGLYENYEDALSIAKQLQKKETMIRKISFSDNQGEDPYIPDYVVLDAQFEMKDTLIGSMEKTIKELDKQFRFEYYPVLDPFLKGDVVKLLGTDCYGIITKYRDMEEKKEQLAEQASYIRNGSISFKDITVRVSILTEYGWLSSSKASPYILEKVTFDRDDPYGELFDEAKNIINSKETDLYKIQDFIEHTQFLLEEIKERRKNAEYELCD